MSKDKIKDSIPANSLEDLAHNQSKINEIRQNNEISKENIQKIENEKLLDDAEALRDNAKVFNALGKFLVWLFFGNIRFFKVKIYFIFVVFILYGVERLNLIQRSKNPL